MAGDLSGTGVVCKRNKDFVVCQEQDSWWSVCQEVFLADAWWSIMDKRIVRSANAYLLFDDINTDMP
jgi:hypothetical protein